MDQRPSVVVEAGSAAGVAHAVRYARARAMRIAPQGTGHGAAPLEPLDGAMLLRTTRMRQVGIDPATGTARAEAGAVWQDVIGPAAEHGLAGLAGSSPGVGVAGYTLGGGIGWLARRYGLAANSVTAAELVTPGGDLVRADAGHEPDLLWAVRGGGGVGVVTALEMRLYPVRELYAGDLFFPIQRAAEVLHAWREWTATVPEKVTSIGHLLRLPPLPEVPEPLRGRAFAILEAAYLGDAGTGAELIGPLRLARRGTGHRRDDPRRRARPAEHGPQPAGTRRGRRRIPGRPPRRGDRRPGRRGRARRRDTAGQRRDPPPGRRAGPPRPRRRSPAQHRRELPAVRRRPRARARPGRPGPRAPAAVKDALAPWHASYDYYNFEDTPATAAAVLPPASYRRLQEIKAAYDPDQAIISAHPAWPARPRT